MTFRLALSADLSAEISRLEHQELEQAFCQLETPDAHSIHEARKHIKKLRALLQLIRPALSKSAHAADDDALRRAGRALAVARDSDALLESFDRVARSLELDAPPAPAAAPRDVAELRAQLAAQQDPAHPGVAAARDILSALLSALETRRLPVRKRELLQGVADTYARGRKRQRALSPGEASERFHDLRKQVKYLQQQLALLEGAWPEPLAALRHEASRLGELLGEHHDLELLEAALARLAPEPGEPGTIGAADAAGEPHEPGAEAAPEPAAPATGALAALQQRIPRVRHALELEALALAARLYVETPEAFGARIGGYVALARASRIAP